MFTSCYSMVCKSPSNREFRWHCIYAPLIGFDGSKIACEGLDVFNCIFSYMMACVFQKLSL